MTLCLETYKAKLAELTANEGKFALIQGDHVVGVFDTYADAIKARICEVRVEPVLGKANSVYRTNPVRFSLCGPLPHFTLQIGPSGPVLKAVVGVSQARQAALQAANQAIPPGQQIWALVDTGASCTCVDPTVLQALQLPPTGSMSVNTPSTGSQPYTANQYDVGIVIPGPSPTHPSYYLHTVAVVEAELLLAQGFHALIGRDVLQHCLFHYNGMTGLFTLAY